jgi:hypothetical protein
VVYRSWLIYLFKELNLFILQIILLMSMHVNNRKQAKSNDEERAHNNGETGHFTLLYPVVFFFPFALPRDATNEG